MSGHIPGYDERRVTVVHIFLGREFPDLLTRISDFFLLELGPRFCTRCDEESPFTQHY